MYFFTQKTDFEWKNINRLIYTYITLWLNASNRNKIFVHFKFLHTSFLMPHILPHVTSLVTEENRSVSFSYHDTFMLWDLYAVHLSHFFTNRIHKCWIKMNVIINIHTLKVYKIYWRYLYHTNLWVTEI